MDLITVIVPIYKVEDYLDRCVESIVGQTYQNLEIILVDDGSPDNCPQICDDWAAKDSRIRVIHQENRGVGATRNVALDIAQGQYIMLVDSDDWLSLDAVQVLYERILADGSDMAVGKHVDAYDDGRKVGTYCDWMQDTVFTKQDIFYQISIKRPLSVSVWGKLFKKKTLDGIVFPGVKHAEDLAVFPEIIENCFSISIVNRVIYFYYQRNSSMMHSKSEIAKMDDLKVNLDMSRYLYDQNEDAAVLYWIERCIGLAYLFEDKRTAVRIINDYYSQREQQRFLKHLKSTIRVKWALLHIPPLANVVDALRKL